jgi:polyhydroxyalkanoate synthesis regulator phasin
MELKQMIDFNKTALEGIFNTMTLVSDRNEKMVDTMLEQAVWMPEEVKKSLKDWMSAYRTACTDFKKMFDESYAKVEAYSEQVDLSVVPVAEVVEG